MYRGKNEGLFNAMIGGRRKSREGEKNFSPCGREGGGIKVNLYLAHPYSWLARCYVTCTKASVAFSPGVEKGFCQALS